MAEDDAESFVSRWSRRKLAAAQPGVAQVPAAAPAAAAPPDLPPVDQLTPDADFSGFMDAKVDDALRRSALKKLFADPRFNVPDGLDDYAEDYTLLEALAPGVASQLAHARTTLFGPEHERAKKSDGQDASDAATTGAAAPAEQPGIAGGKGELAVASNADDDARRTASRPEVQSEGVPGAAESDRDTG